MKIHRFIGDFQLDGARVESLDSSLINQIKNVLRLKVGDKVTLVDENANEALARIFLIRKDVLQFDILERATRFLDPLAQVSLFCSVLKKENFEWVVEKATEVGIAKIIPIVSERTVKLNINEDRLKKIAKEASEQSGRSKMPLIFDPISYEEAITFSRENDINFIFNMEGENINKYSKEIGRAERIGLFIGPEGGWTEEEISLARSERFPILSLGELTLRAETAAIIAAYTMITNKQ